MGRQVDERSGRTQGPRYERPAASTSSRTSGPRPERRTMASMSHEQAAEMLVDFELGRLSARRSAAVEQHVRSCEICRKQGLGHAVTERRQIIRKLDRVRPTRRIFSARARAVILVLMIALLFELIVFELLHNSALH